MSRVEQIEGQIKTLEEDELRALRCMVHSGYEASSVDYGFGSLRGFFAMAKASLFSR